mmetsp:Transcript_14229/g.27776  ORF Transcript_14229/g.27776 Transcript_14229/m.27776 type:complete len:126 (+) Transcript_14229:142-519(+)
MARWPPVPSLVRFGKPLSAIIESKRGLLPCMHLFGGTKNAKVQHAICMLHLSPPQFEVSMRPQLPGLVLASGDGGTAYSNRKKSAQGLFVSSDKENKQQGDSSRGIGQVHKVAKCPEQRIKPPQS